MSVCGSLLFDFFGVIVALVVVSVTVFKWRQSYWKRKQFQYLEPQFPWGNIPSFRKNSENLGVSIAKIYEQMKAKKWKHGGMYIFATPQYLAVDLDIVKHILTKDFQHFVDRGVYYNERDDPLSAHLFAIGGSKWRNLRSKLTPTFTSGKMKMMFHTLIECEHNLLEKIKTEYEAKRPIDIKELLGCFTTDIIGSCAFGLECNTFKDDDSPFRKYGKKVFQQDFRRRLKVSFVINLPYVGRLLRMKFVPQDVSDFFMNVVKDTVSYREKSDVTRKDFLQLLMDLKNNKLAESEGYQHDGKTLTIEEIAAQCFVFFLAGFETSSTTMTFALFELAKSQEIQDKVRAEINAVLAKHGGQITYEGIQEMVYLQQVIEETLRMYPPVPFITRRCVQDYKVPNENVIIEKGTRVIIPILGIHRDDEYYPNPQKFDPERFNEKNSKLRHQYAHIPFGEGPRLCIGMRFGIMQSKVGLTSLLRNYRFRLNKKTRNPLEFQGTSFVLAAQGDVWLDAEAL